MTSARTDNLDTKQGRDEVVAVTSLHDEFPALPVRIIAAIVAAYRPSKTTAAELVPAVRQRLLDALAA